MGGGLLTNLTLKQARLVREGGFRMVPTFVTAHTFCASRDTRITYGWCPLVQGYFCAV